MRLFHVERNFDIIVVGAGHAGCEAALAASRMGTAVALVTMDKKKIGEMSCNPSIGGVGKGQLVKEIDALGGEMGINADYTAIQFRRLNTRKGSAVQSSRCQSDKIEYAKRMQKVVSSQAGLEIIEGEVKRLLVKNGSIHGVSILTPLGAMELKAFCVVITSGTFMRGIMHCGTSIRPGGRYGENASVGLSDALRALGFSILRLKTGTPARLLRDSIDFSQMERQESDPTPKLFSFSKTESPLQKVPCYLTYTREATHSIIAKNLDKSPLYSGQIQGIGPRYCPSIEDKVVKFKDKPRHALFFEPESLSSNWIYPNGISTSLPPEVQDEFIRTIPGCENVRVARFGYAVEYDCIDPRQLTDSLESKNISGLFLAGQVNGTSGYEEAAAQGLIAGINAGLKVKGQSPFLLKREESYIGVMLDDLVSKGVTEPYRMFTSRAEYRLRLREDNADLRLRKYGYQLGLVFQNDYDQFFRRKSAIESGKMRLHSSYPKNGNGSWAQMLKRPEISLEDIFSDVFTDVEMSDAREWLETLEIEIKYEGYIALQDEEVARIEKLRNVPLPAALNYGSVIGLSTEVREKLSRERPLNLADASRISGVTPVALSAILFHVRQ